MDVWTFGRWTFGTLDVGTWTWGGGRLDGGGLGVSRDRISDVKGRIEGRRLVCSRAARERFEAVSFMHDLSEIRDKSQDLMEELGERYLGEPLQAIGWKFQFDRARRRLGICWWEHAGRRVRVISLSRFYAGWMGWSEMEDVVRHEVAHAIDFETRGKSDHGPVWQAIACKVGADPTRLYEGPFVPDRGSKYVGICPSCEIEHPFYRRVIRIHACSVCCRAHNRGRFAPRYTLRILERETGRDVSPQRPAGMRSRRGVDR